MSFDDDVVPDVRIELDAAPISARALASQPPSSSRREHREPYAIRGEIVRTKRRSLWGWLFLVLSLLLLGGGVGAVYAAPYYVRIRVAEAGRRSGLTVTVAGVVFRPDALTLTGIEVGLPGLEGVSVNVSEVEILLEKARPKAIIVHGADITLRGDARELTSAIVQWAGALAEPLALQASSGHVTWIAPFGEGTELTTFDTTLSTVSGFSVTAPSLMVGTPRGRLGPWTVSLSRGLTDVRLTLGLDASSPPSKLLLAFPKDGGATMTLEAPSSPLSRLGVPPETFGLSGDPTLEVHAALARSAGGHVDGHLALSVFALRIASAKPPAPALDVRFTSGLAGESTDSMTFTEALVGVGAAKGKATGTLAFKERGAHADLALRWSGAGAATLPSALVLDTHDLSPAAGR
jgi:hypothetical protein